MSRVLRKTLIMPAYLNESPVLTLERDGARRKYELLFAPPVESLIVSNGTSAVTLTEKAGIIDLYVDFSLAAAIVVNGEIVSFATSGVDMTKEDFSRRFLPIYDDEAVAENNYYEAYHDKENEDARTEDFDKERAVGEKGDGGASTDDAGGGAFKKQSAAAPDRGKKQSSDGAYQIKVARYGRVAGNIAALFASGEPYRPLSEVVPFSRWVKIDEGGKTRFFGVQGDDDYACLAARGERSRVLSGFEDAFFYPENFYGQTESGYFVTFEKLLDE